MARSRTSAKRARLTLALIGCLLASTSAAQSVSPMRVTLPELRYQGPTPLAEQPTLTVQMPELIYSGPPPLAEAGPISMQLPPLSYQGPEPLNEQAALTVQFPELLYQGPEPLAEQPTLTVQMPELIYSGPTPLNEQPAITAKLSELVYQGPPPLSEAAPLRVTLPALLFDSPAEQVTDRRRVEFKLVRVTPLRGDNTIEPFDYRDVGRAIERAGTLEEEPQDDPQEEAFTPQVLQFSNVPMGGVFSSIDLRPRADETRWEARTGSPGNVNPMAALGFYGTGYTGGGYQLRFEAGSGWSSMDLPATVTLAQQGFSNFETRTLRVTLTRRSDDTVFRLSLDVSAGSDGEIELGGANGYYCGTERGNCP